MKTLLLRFAVSGTLLVGAVSACKRSDDAPLDTNATRIIGSWRESYRAVDSNANGQADSSERFSTGYFRLLSFYKDGTVRDTLYINGVASATHASYSLNGDYLSIIFPGLPPTRILQLDDSKLVLSDSSQRPAMITAFNRQ